MGRDRSVLNWRMITEDADWEQVQHPPPDPFVPNSSKLGRHRIVWAASLAVVAIVGVCFLWCWAQSGLDQIATDLEDAFTLENWSTPASTAIPPLATPDDHTVALPSHPEVTLVDFVPQRDFIFADVQVCDPMLPLVYRETRCYARTEHGLERIEMASAFWGEQQQIESDYFTFLFFPRDAAAIAQAAPAFDALYERLVTLLELDMDRPLCKIVVDVTNEAKTSTLTYSGTGSRTLHIPSPKLMPIPVSMNDSEYLVQAATAPLMRLLVYKVMDDSEASQRWRPMFEALRLWLFWEGGGPLSVFRSDVMYWLYLDNTECTSLSLADRSERYQMFCQTLRSFNLQPLDLSLPLPCDGEVGATQAVLYVFSSNWPVSLEDLAVPLTCTWSVDPHRLYCLFPPNIPTRLTELIAPALAGHTEAAEINRLLTYRAQVVAMTTILEYAESEYGAGAPIGLIHAIVDHEDWESLIPAVYGVDAATFEAGWQEYVKSHYGLDGAVGVEFFDALARFETEVTVSYGIYKGE